MAWDGVAPPRRSSAQLARSRRSPSLACALGAWCVSLVARGCRPVGAPSSSRRRSALAARRGIFARLGTTPAAPTPPSPSRAAEARSSAPALALRPRPPRTVASTTSRAGGASRRAATCLVATALPAAAASCPRAGPCGSGPDRPGSPRVGATAAPRPGPRGTLALGQQVPAPAALSLELL